MRGMSKARTEQAVDPAANGGDTRKRIKAAASRLFANRGVDGVSVRDIVIESGQKNGGSLHYYFRSKETLVRELVADGAKLIDERRNRMLDEIESRKRLPNLREIIAILLWPAMDPEPDPEHPATYIRFITALRTNHRELFVEALESKWDSGYRRCIEHIRRLLPTVPDELLNQRLIFMSLYLQVTLSAREAALEHGGSGRRLWAQPEICENLIDTVRGLLTEKPSAPTLNRFKARRTPSRSAR